MRTANLLNKRFFKLIVLELLKTSRGGSRQWLCRCDCGKYATVTTRHLTRKTDNIKSCGCLKHSKGKEHKDWKGFGDISGDWWATHILREKSQTARVRVPVTITIEEAWNLFIKQNKRCALSGIPLFFGKSSHNNSASLDRIDSSLGYEISNVQWVHKHINFMKRNYTNDYFIKMCKLIAKFNKGM